MTALVRAEWRKVFTTRMVWGLLGGTVVYTAVSVLANVFASALAQGQQGVPALDSRTGMHAVFSSASSGYVFTLVLGVLGMTGEYRHGTVTSTFLAEPRRWRVVVAKLVAYPVVSLGFALVAVATTLVLAVPLVALRGASLSSAGGEIPRILLGAVAAVTLYVVLGLGFGALIRNQVAALISALVYVLLAESLLVSFLPTIGKWLPGGAAAALTLTTPQRGGALLPQWAAALLFLAYGVALAAVGTKVTVDRDIS